MQFSRALITLIAAGLASAQLPNVPECSLNCFVTALTTDGCSSLTDFACHCQKTSLVSTITPCVKEACNVADQSSVSNAVVDQCSSAGHPIVVPPVGGGSTTTSGDTSSSTETSSSSESTSSSSSSSEVSSSTPTESSSSAVSSTPASSTPASSSAAPTSTNAGSGSTRASASSPPLFTGAACNVKGNMAGVAAVAAAAAYIL